MNGSELLQPGFYWLQHSNDYPWELVQLDVDGRVYSIGSDISFRKEDWKNAKFVGPLEIRPPSEGNDSGWDTYCASCLQVLR